MVVLILLANALEGRTHELEYGANKDTMTCMCIYRCLGIVLFKRIEHSHIKLI